MSKLKAIKPEAKEKRLKMFVYGPAGVGKTMGCIQFPHAYIIDTENGDALQYVNNNLFENEENGK